MTTTDAVETFEGQRGRLFGLAYRLLGSAAEAEDAVQEAFLRWNGADQEQIASPPAWLTKVVTNLCLTALTSARARRERYVGPWLPEPVETSGDALGPLDTVERRDSVSFALLVLLERLTPAERAVFVLREAFGYGYGDIARTLDLSEPNCRQLYHRAGERVREGRARFGADDGKRRELVERFLDAAQDGELRGLEELLAADVTIWSDGGGKVSAARRPITGRDKVLRLLEGVARHFVRMRVERAEINGGSALLFWTGDELRMVLVPDLTDDGTAVSDLRLVANPDKLEHLARRLGGVTPRDLAWP
ncbi:RNA polymerase sigma-70 factor [Allonocardiopsis opalescens]|uniref:RNA polymerase ECF family sigma subunit n=1 Tax=Allonocardiopsis opalescens TaxID=1144618 RepID=A0A2T0Q0P8_9ACTN|nr:RNA polymerase sigma-70 factor [Allonocardiopsis opalescens]PRX97367.1 RNA polymerase ECF family sigma subunit [Allonocardiopsis opalescens]